MTPLLLEWCEAQLNAALARDRIRQAIPAPTQPRSALQYCLGACPVSEEYRSLAVILSGMREAGYQSKSRNPTPYVKRILRESGRFHEAADGRWRQLGPREPFDHLREDSYTIRFCS